MEKGKGWETNPEDQLHIVSVPGVAKMVGEEAPWVVVVFIWEEDANAPAV